MRRSGASPEGAEPGREEHHLCEACGREFMQSHAEFKKASQARLLMEVHREPEMLQRQPPVEPGPQVDTGKRYDVYCTEPYRGVVVYRNVLFKGANLLLPGSGPGGRIVHQDFLELEQANGQTIFISRGSVFRFCEPGTEVLVEVIPAEKHS